MKGKRNYRELAIVMSALVFSLAGGIAVLVVSAAMFKTPVFGPQPVQGFTTVLLFIYLMLSMSTGIMLGMTLWICAMKPLLSRDELERYATQPYISIVSDVLHRVFDIVYREK